MKPEIALAMREVLEAWETPDSPESFTGAMLQMKRVYIAEKKKPKRMLVGWKCPKCSKYYRQYGMEVSQHQMICQPEIYKP